MAKVCGCLKCVINWSSLSKRGHDVASVSIVSIKDCEKHVFKPVCLCAYVHNVSIKGREWTMQCEIITNEGEL